MSNSHDKLATRLGIILTKLNLGEKFSIDDLIEEFGVSKRTIQRDMQARLINFPIEYEDGVYYLDSKHLGKLDFNDIRGFATISGIKDLYPRIDDSFLTSLINNKFNDIYLIKNTQYEQTKNKSLEFEIIENAIKDKLKITCKYNEKQRELNPYRLINKSGIWYLSADENNQLKTYTLSKIINIIATNIKFSHNKEFINIIKTNKDDWFSKDNIEITLEVKNTVAQYFLRRDLLPHQKIIKQTKTHLTLYTKVSYEEEILTIVKHWIPNIKIISPKHLQDKLNNTLRNYIK